MRNPRSHLQPEKEGSALLMVLAVVVVLAVLVTTFGSDMKSEVQAADSHYAEALNFQLARSALAMARLELNRKNTALYADDFGNAFFVRSAEDYEADIEALMQYRQGIEVGRGFASYRLVYKSNALDPNKVSPNDWHRLLEVACGMEEGEERNELVDAFFDWIDPDNLARANGAEEEFYRELEPPRHVKNAPVSSYEEILLIHGFTPDMLYGYSNPVHIEDNMLVGGGLLRWFIGDNSPEARAAVKYIIDGTLPAEPPARREDGDRFRKVPQLPDHLYLIAQGFAPDQPPADDVDLLDETADDEQLPEPVYESRHIILVRLEMQQGKYRIGDLLENAPTEAVERILAFGLPDTEKM